MLHSQEFLWFFHNGHENMIRQLANQYTEKLPFVFVAGFYQGGAVKISRTCLFKRLREKPTGPSNKACFERCSFEQWSVDPVDLLFFWGGYTYPILKRWEKNIPPEN